MVLQPESGWGRVGWIIQSMTVRMLIDEQKETSRVNTEDVGHGFAGLANCDLAGILEQKGRDRGWEGEGSLMCEELKLF